jgi:hypothetical protein
MLNRLSLYSRQIRSKHSLRFTMANLEIKGPPNLVPIDVQDNMSQLHWLKSSTDGDPSNNYQSYLNL